MTIPELLRAIAGSDELPRYWRIQAQREWTLDGATEPETREEAVLEYRDDNLPKEASGARWIRLGAIETSEPLRYTSDWIDRIIVERDVPSSILFPFQAAVGTRSTIELRPEPEIPF